MYEISLEVENAKKMWVCQQCLGDTMLKQLSAQTLADRTCIACGHPKRNALTPERIASFIREYMPEHFIVDDGRFPGYEMSLADIVSRAIRCNTPDVCSAIAEQLVDTRANENDFYWLGQVYCAKPRPFESDEHERWHVIGAWERVANDLTHGRRFFNDEVRRFFDSLISEALNATDTAYSELRPAVRIMPIGSNFYRARIASGISEAKDFKDMPADKLGAPPRKRAANNRMSPAGASLLYVSNNAETCIAEVRPSIGDLVVVGRFISTSALKIFDFTSLSKRLVHAPLSYFDARYEERVEHRRLLEYLHDEIARPVRASNIDYVVTQALAEFIRYETSEKFDGIAFRSVQCTEGINYVLFDDNTQGSINAPNVRPQFNLDISVDAVIIHRISAVHYDQTVVEEAN